ncbi:MAG TPA: O-antigen ligase family protein [Candidatus Sulfotelmatobacter sp.]|nr:O-antigen ligase family protein [Candidatus Sulfotelmatobacter sp.]
MKGAVRHLLERVGGWLPAAVALALPITFIPLISDSYILPRASIVIAGACLGVGLSLLGPGSLGLGTLRWPLLTAALAALLAFAFSISWPLSLAGSYTRYESLPMRLSYLGLLASAVWLLRTERQREWVAGAFVFATSVACLKAWAQWYVHAPFRPDGDLGNANLLAALVAMGIPLAVSRAVRAGGWFSAAWAMAVVVMGVGLWTTTSRSGLLGALAGCLVLGLLAVPRRFAVPAAAGAVAVMLGLLEAVHVYLNTLNSDPGELRLGLWRDGLHMVAARPITGWGPDTTGLAFGHFLSQDYATLVTFDRIHSGPLDIAATQGVVGLAALGWVLVVLAIGAWRHCFAGNVTGLAGALAGYTVWVAFNFDWAPATGMFWLLAGTLWSSAMAPTSSATPSPRGFPSPRRGAINRRGQRVLNGLCPQGQGEGVGTVRTLGALVLVLAAIPLAALPLLADGWYLHGRADLAIAADPLQAQYHWALGEGFFARGDTGLGLAELRRAADLGETEPGMYVELGDHEEQLGEKVQARADYRRALQIDPYYSPAADRLRALGP